MFLASPSSVLSSFLFGNQNYCRILVILLVLLICPSLFTGCSCMLWQRAPKLNGTFSGTDIAGQPVTITFQQRKNTVIGSGQWGSAAFSLSALTAPQGPMAMTFDNGNLKTGQVTLSPTGKSVTVKQADHLLTLQRGGTPIPSTTGHFSGLFVMRDDSSVSLRLQQTGVLMAGTGFIEGKPVAVTGKMTGAGQAKGTVLFSDESRNKVTAKLSEDLQTLTITGLGGPILMERQ